MSSVSVTWLCTNLKYMYFKRCTKVNSTLIGWRGGETVFIGSFFWHLWQLLTWWIHLFRSKYLTEDKQNHLSNSPWIIMKKKYPFCHICLDAVPVVGCDNPVQCCPHAPMVPCARVVVALLQHGPLLLLWQHNQPQKLGTGASVEQLIFCHRQICWQWDKEQKYSHFVVFAVSECLSTYQRQSVLLVSYIRPTVGYIFFKCWYSCIQT